MGKKTAFLVVLAVVVGVSSLYWSSTSQGKDAGDSVAQTQPATTASRIEYGRLVFVDDKYNWIAGDEPVRNALDARGLINRLGGKPKRSNFATLLDTLGARGWELVFETEDPEGYGQVLIFKRVN